MPCDFADLEFISVICWLFFSQTIIGLIKFYLRNLVSCVFFSLFPKSVAFEHVYVYLNVCFFPT